MSMVVSEELKQASLVSFDIETTGTDDGADVVSIAVAWKNCTIQSRAYWIDPKDTKSYRSVRSEVAEILKISLFSPDFKGIVIFHNLDFDLRFLLRDFWREEAFSFNKICPNLADTLTISRVHRNNKYVAHIDAQKRSCHSLKYLAEEHLGEEQSSFDEATDGIHIRLANRNKVLKYNADDAELTIRLYERFMDGLLLPNEKEYVRRIEMPHLLNLFQMNWFGVLFDREKSVIILSEAFRYLQELEVTIYQGVGRSFNISSQPELSSALFYNRNLLWNGEPIRPLFITPLEQPKVDVDTLLKLSKRIAKTEPKSKTIEVIRHITQYLELSKAITQIENMAYYARKTGDSYRIMPRFKADAKSGRVKVSKPNLLGLSKEIFKKSHKEGVPESLKFFSPRNLLISESDSRIGSSDVNALDLSVVAHGAKEHNHDFEWLRYFGDGTPDSGLDIHMSVFRRMNPNEFQKVMRPFADHCHLGNLDDYDVKEVEKTYIKLIHRQSRVPITIPEKSELMTEGLSTALSNLSKRRKLFKEVNLSTSYLVGDKRLAQNINEKAGLELGADEARDLLEQFYKIYPEIRLFQDKVSNTIYENGFYPSVLGRHFYADCFDELNDFYHRHGNALYEFICLIEGRYWYIKTEKWVKEAFPVVENMVVLGGSFGLAFNKVVTIEELDRYTFRKKNKKVKSKFQRKSEENQEDVTDYQLTRIQITQALDSELLWGGSVTMQAQRILDRFFMDGSYRIPEKYILFYRVDLQSPASKYFRFYVPFKRAIRKFFPLYCQGVANSIATMALTKLRVDLEISGNIEARILLFIHDEIVAQSKVANEKAVAELMTKAISSPKSPFEVSLTSKDPAWVEFFS